MFEILGIIALSILAVIMAAVGVGMAGEKTGKKSKEKPYDIFRVSSFGKPIEKLAEKASNVAEKGRGYVEKGVKKLDNSSVVGGTVAGYTFLSSVYQVIANMDVKDMPYGAMAALVDAENALQHPVQRLGKWGALAHNIAYGAHENNPEKDLSGYKSLSKAMSLRVNPENKRAIEEYLKNYLRGSGDYNIEIVEKIDGGKTWGALKDNNMEIARFVDTSEGEYEQNLLDILVTALHEDKEKKQRVQGTYTNEAGVEKATVVQYRDEMERARKELNLEKYHSSKLKLYANLDYILRQEEPYRKELSKIPEISKEMDKYLRETNALIKGKHWKWS